uniref:Uncharacterized protein n=1 Tax=Gorilla gorilla gorilla TaxID=9595 RepID=A0A2I2YW91_GORGO
MAGIGGLQKMKAPHTGVLHLGSVWVFLGPFLLGVGYTLMFNPLSGCMSAVRWLNSNITANRTLSRSLSPHDGEYLRQMLLNSSSRAGEAGSWGY